MSRFILDCRLADLCYNEGSSFLPAGESPTLIYSTPLLLTSAGFILGISDIGLEGLGDTLSGIPRSIVTKKKNLTGSEYLTRQEALIFGVPILA